METIIKNIQNIMITIITGGIMALFTFTFNITQENATLKADVMYLKATVNELKTQSDFQTKISIQNQTKLEDIYKLHLQVHGKGKNFDDN